MKQIVIVLILFIGYNSEAQNLSVEINGMPGYHRVVSQSVFPKGNFQMNHGLVVTKHFSNNFSLSSGLNTRFLKRQTLHDIYIYEFYQRTDTVVTKSNYIELPINCGYHYKGFFIRGGFNLNYLASAEFSINNEVISTEKGDEMIYLVGLNAALGYQFTLSEKWYINSALFYDYPILLANPFKSPLMNYGLLLGLGYNIN